MLPTQKNSIAFFTCCYEADWKFFLKEGRLKEMIDRCNYLFTSRNLIINNVKDRRIVEEYAYKAVTENIIDNFYFSEDHIDEALDRFSLKKKDFRLDGFDGYWYSVAPLTASVLCNAGYLLYFMGDCMLNKKYAFDWIDMGVEKLQQESVFCITPLWSYYDGRGGMINEDELCYYDYGFSDQVFLVNTKSFLSVNYKEYNAKSEIFPIYGGNHFERKIFCFINNHQLSRCILKQVKYSHEKLILPEYINKTNSESLKTKAKYLIAKAKKMFRKRNILVKYLLRCFL